MIIKLECRERIQHHNDVIDSEKKHFHLGLQSQTLQLSGGNSNSKFFLKGRMQVYEKCVE